MMERAPTPASTPVTPVAPAAGERGWGRLLIALAAFFFLPMLPQLRALLPVEQSIDLLVPAIAACALAGWWAGGRAFLAIAWVAVATLLMAQPPSAPTAFDNLARGWCLLLAGSFGLVCLLGTARPLFSRALATLAITLGLALVITVTGPVTVSQAVGTISAEFARRNAETVNMVNTTIQAHPQEWADLTAKMPQLAAAPAETAKQLRLISVLGVMIFPAMLALQSLAALALAWATYHRLARSRVGPPLRPLREFRFNDQLVWGLIVGLTILLLPTLRTLNGFGTNLVVFFGALYAVRGFGVLTWFLAPGKLGITVTVALVLLFAPVLGAYAALLLLMLGVAALALGLGDTWADWRSRARSAS